VLLGCIDSVLGDTGSIFMPNRKGEGRHFIVRAS
jgi:hypothetical protein